MSVAVITGSGGLIGSAAVRFVHDKGLDAVGLDNNARRHFFGSAADTTWNVESLRANCSRYTHHHLDIRDENGVNGVFSRYGKAVSLVIHTAAQPSHDWARRDPLTDFSINATGTLMLLEAVRKHCPDAAFVFTSTNKVYGDTVNTLAYRELETRFEPVETEPYAEHGVDEGMSLDRCTHSIFGVSKASADLLVQEYGRYFGMRTGVFRGGCLTGSDHSAAELHGFLGYLMRCAIKNEPYTVYGYKGKQVRDNIHARDIVNAFWHFFESPRPGEVYNMGGARHANISMREAVAACEKLTGRPMRVTYTDEERIGDHKWWISDVRKFQSHYPGWRHTCTMDAILEEIYEGMLQRKEKL
ncbi:NAD-dependent epimerase/dehydratase family protein [Desulfovibrio sp. OttesenSCG-928-O18]|nr:NAD-dependent epimerase/dehydratase family protein [Desulfovibrio sp. OttesenSCG-928-O18]